MPLCSYASPCDRSLCCVYVGIEKNQAGIASKTEKMRNSEEDLEVLIAQGSLLVKMSTKELTV